MPVHKVIANDNPLTHPASLAVVTNPEGFRPRVEHFPTKRIPVRRKKMRKSKTLALA